MSDYDFPYGFVYTYKDSEKHFITDEKFISHYLLYIIDYFYIKNIDISDAINIDNINKCLHRDFNSWELKNSDVKNIQISNISEIHDIIQKYALMVDFNNNDNIYNENIYKYIPQKDPFDIIIYIFNNINIESLARSVEYYNYFKMFTLLTDISFYSQYRNHIYPKLIEDISIMNDEELRRLFACILEDVWQNTHPEKYKYRGTSYVKSLKPRKYKNFPLDLLELYKISECEYDKYIHENGDLHNNQHEYFIDIYYNHLQNTPISKYKHLIKQYYKIYYKNTYAQDSDLATMMLTNHFEVVFPKLSQSDKYVIYGCPIGEDSPCFEIISYIIKRMWNDFDLYDNIY